LPISSRDGWHEKIQAKMEWLGCLKLLLCQKDEATFDVIPSKTTIDEIEEKTTKSADDKKILKLQVLDKIASSGVHAQMNFLHEGSPSARP